MSDFDAYQDEMDRILTERAADRLFAGAAPEELGDLDDFLREIQGDYAGACREPLAARHIAEISAAARATGVTVPVGSGRPTRGRTGMHRIVRLGAKVVAAGLGAVAISAGAAFAGLNFPGPVEEVFDSLGIDAPEDVVVRKDLPEGARADEVLTVVKGLDAKALGCRFGMAVAAVASGGENAEAGDPCSKGEEGRARGRAKAERGRERARDARSEAPAASGRGLEKAEEASDGRSGRGLSTAGGASKGKSSKGLSTADEASGGASDDVDPGQSGRDIGADASADGRSNKPDDAGRP